MSTGPIGKAPPKLVVPQQTGAPAEVTGQPPVTSVTTSVTVETFTKGDPRAQKTVDPGEVARAPVPQQAVFGGELHMDDAELQAAIVASIGVRSHTAELPTPDEVRALKAQGKDVVFSKLALEEAKNLPDLSAEFAKRPRIEGVTFSIDKYETTDLDNAISYRPGEDGTHYVSVTGTDVSAWVRPGGALDFAARRRAETQYMSQAGLVLPMLPLFLSEGKLSLFEGKERLAKTTELHYSADGQLLGARIYKSVVSNVHLSDEDAAEAREGRGRGAKSPELAQALKALTELGAKLGGGKGSGAISIEKMTPLFTTAAATEVGKALKAAGLETSYRNQEQGKKSLYDEVPLGHAGIGAEAYATFTGPMRRYADLDVQRAIDRLLDGRKPEGRVKEIDHRMRDVQLDRLNGVTRDPKLRVRDALTEVTRKPADQVGAPPEKPNTPPMAPDE